MTADLCCTQVIMKKPTIPVAGTAHCADPIGRRAGRCRAWARAEKMRLFLGYAGWGPGQIEGELQDNAWLVCDANIADIFTSQSDDLYEKCVAAMGINLALLSNEGGEA